MAQGDVDIQRHADGTWHIFIHGSYDSQEEAIAAAQAIARRLGRESFIRSLTGRWRGRNTYPRARDPKKSRG